MVGHVLKVVLLRIPSHIHKQRDGILHRFQVTYVQNPHTLNAVVVGQRELFEHLLRLRDIEPFCITRCTDIVHMIVDAPATLTGALLGIDRHATDIAPVVVTNQYHHVVRHFESGIIIVLYLLIECPHLRSLLSRLARHFLDNLALVIDDTLHQLRVGLVAHRLVAVTTHTNRHNILGTLHALNTFTEKLVELFLVGLVVPGAPLVTLTGILLVVAGHRLVVRGTHDDTHRIGGLQILGIIGIECPAPHRRPHKVTLQTQNELEDLGIEAVVAIVGTKSILHPCRQTGGLVVQEQATKLYGRLSISILSRQYTYIVALCYGNVHPPVPGRHTHLARQFIDAIYCTTTVTTGNNYLSVDGGDDKLLALTLQVS